MRRSAAALMAFVIPAVIAGCGGDDSRPTAAADETTHRGVEAPATAAPSSSPEAEPTPSWGTSSDPEVARLLGLDWADERVPYIARGSERNVVQLSDGHHDYIYRVGMGSELDLLDVFAGRLGGVPTAVVVLQQHAFSDSTDERDVQAVLYQPGDDPSQPLVPAGYIHNDTPDAVEGSYEFAYRMEGDVLTQFRRPAGSGTWSAFSVSVGDGQLVEAPKPEPLPRASDWQVTGQL